jgi:hypothetical protein
MGPEGCPAGPYRRLVDRDLPSDRPKVAINELEPAEAHAVVGVNPNHTDLL